MFPNEVNLVNNFGPSAGVTFDNNTAKTDSISFVSMEGAAASALRGGETERMVHGTWSHVATQSWMFQCLALRLILPCQTDNLVSWL